MSASNTSRTNLSASTTPNEIIKIIKKHTPFPKPKLIEDLTIYISQRERKVFDHAYKLGARHGKERSTKRTAERG